MGEKKETARAEPPLVAIVTGGNRGLGLETCRQLAVLGFRVVLTSRNPKLGEVAVAALRESGLTVVAHQLDVTDPLSVERLVADVDAAYDRIDVLVNNAGVALRPADDLGTLQVDIETIRQTLEVNTLAPLRLCQAVVPVMRRGGYGRVVNVSSGMGQLDDMENGWPAYRISKTALSAVTRLVAREVSWRQRPGQRRVSGLGAHRHGRQQRHPQRRGGGGRNRVGGHAARPRSERLFLPRRQADPVVRARGAAARAIRLLAPTATLLLACALAAAGTGPPLKTAGEPWIIDGPVVIHDPLAVGDVIIVGGGSLHVAGVPEPGFQVSGNLWAIGNGELVLEDSVVQFLSTYHGQYSLAAVEQARARIAGCDYRVPNGVQHGLIAAGSAELTVEDTDFGDVQIIAADSSRATVQRLTGNFEVIVQHAAVMSLADIPRIPDQGSIWVWVEFGPGSESRVLAADAGVGRGVVVPAARFGRYPADDPGRALRGPAVADAGARRQPPGAPRHRRGKLGRGRPPPAG